MTNNTSTTISRAEIYDPLTGTSTTTNSMSTNRSYHTTTLLPNGKVLVTGGISGSTSYSSAELFNPSPGIWTSAGSMSTNRSQHTATLLPNGKVLVAGGFIGGFNYSSSADLYDPSAGTWTRTGPMNSARDASTDFPIVQLRSIESGQTLFLSSANWQTNAFASSPIGSFPPGYTLVTAFVNGIPSTGVVINVSVPVPTPPVLVNPQHFAGGQFQFNFTNAQGALFAVMTATNLALPPTNWTTLGGVSEVSPGHFQFTDTRPAGEPQRYYRVRSP